MIAWLVDNETGEVVFNDWFNMQRELEWDREDYTPPGHKVIVWLMAPPDGIRNLSELSPGHPLAA